jgi:hypothetical protein
MAPAAMAAAQAATQPMVAGVSAAMISGLAHDGMDSIPETGTWLLKKGERVTTEKTSKRLDDTLNRVQYEMNVQGSGVAVKSNMASSSNGIQQHIHFDGPVFLNRSQIKDVSRMFMDEFERERTRMGAVR